MGDLTLSDYNLLPYVEKVIQSCARYQDRTISPLGRAVVECRYNGTNDLLSIVKKLHGDDRIRKTETLINAVELLGRMRNDLEEQWRVVVDCMDFISVQHGELQLIKLENAIKSPLGKSLHFDLKNVQDEANKLKRQSALWWQKIPFPCWIIIFFAIVLAANVLEEKQKSGPKACPN